MHCMCRRHYSFIHRWTLGCFHLLALMNNAATILGVPNIFFQCLLSIPLGGYPEVALLDHMVILFNFVRNCHAGFCSMAPFHTRFSNAQRSQFLQNLFQYCYLLFLFVILCVFACVFYNSHSAGSEVILIYISLMIVMLSIFPCASWPSVCIFFVEMSIQILCSSIRLFFVVIEL